MNFLAFLFIPAVLLVTLINLWWYRIKFILKNNGYKVDWFYNHWANFSQFKDLIRKSESEKATRYQKIYSTLIGFLFALLGIFLTWLIGGIFWSSYGG